MKRVYYASGSVLTGDRVAEAIVRYAGALAMRDCSDVIDIPISLGDGRTARAQLLIGPASQFFVIPEAEVQEGPEDEATIADLTQRARLLSSPRPHASDESTHSSFSEGDEFGE